MRSCRAVLSRSFTGQSYHTLLSCRFGVQSCRAVSAAGSYVRSGRSAEIRLRLPFSRCGGPGEGAMPQRTVGRRSSRWSLRGASGAGLGATFLTCRRRLAAWRLRRPAHASGARYTVRTPAASGPSACAADIVSGDAGGLLHVPVSVPATCPTTYPVICSGVCSGVRPCRLYRCNRWGGWQEKHRRIAGGAQKISGFPDRGSRDLSDR